MDGSQAARPPAFNPPDTPPHPLPYPVPFTIRSFRNTDVDAICRAWNAHFADQGAANQLLPLAFELGCLSKPFFHQRDLLVAEAEQEVVGFLHLARLPMDSLESEALDTLSIAAFCIAPHSEENAIAASLLARCDQAAEQQSIGQILFKPMLPENAFYIGYGPADSLIGNTSHDQRTCQWIRQAGFQPSKPTNLWELDLARFQPPVDRMQLQIRRMAHVDRQVDEPLLPWWQACVLGHTEAAAFQLTDRLQKRVLYEVLFWTVAPELQSTANAVAWLWPPALPPQPLPNDSRAGETLDSLVFLLAESLRELQSENIDLVRTASKADNAAMSQLMRRLGFKPVLSGFVFDKSLPFDEPAPNIPS